MKIYHFSRFLALPFLLVIGFFAYKVLLDIKYEHFGWAIIPMAFLVLIYLFQPQLDYWWMSRNPVELEPRVLKMLDEHNPVYKNLNSEKQQEFNKRLALYLNGKEFIAKGMEQDFDLPHDVKNMVAQIPITMTLNKKDFLFKDLDRIIIYKHAFPSPMYKFLHTVETHVEDGMLIFALDHAEAAFFNPDQYYNVAWHAYSYAYIKTFPSENYPDIVEQDWQTVEQVLGFSKEAILQTLGFKSIDLMPVLMTCFFVKNIKLKEINPKLYTAFENIFQLNIPRV